VADDVVFFAGDFLAVDFLAVDFVAVDLFAVVFFAVDGVAAVFSAGVSLTEVSSRRRDA